MIRSILTGALLFIGVMVSAETVDLQSVSGEEIFGDLHNFSTQQRQDWMLSEQGTQYIVDRITSAKPEEITEMEAHYAMRWAVHQLRGSVSGDPQQAKEIAEKAMLAPDLTAFTVRTFIRNFNTDVAALNTYSKNIEEHSAWLRNGAKDILLASKRMGIDPTPYMKNLIGLGDLSEGFRNWFRLYARNAPPAEALEAASRELRALMAIEEESPERTKATRDTRTKIILLRDLVEAERSLGP